jgi:hypothetical protein
MKKNKGQQLTSKLVDLIDSKILASERSTLVPFFNCSKIADGSKNRGRGEGKKTKGNVLAISASSMLKQHDKYRNSKKNWVPY